MPKEDWGVAIEGGYFHEATHIYRNLIGTPVPSSTQVFGILGLSDFSMVKPSDLEWKRVFGDAVHAAVQYLVWKDLDWDTIDSEIIAPVTGIEQRLREMDFIPEASEELRIGNFYGMKYGMRLDHRGTIMHQGKRRNAVIDLKTGSKYSPTWTWQIGSYIHPQPKVPLGWIGVVLQVDPAGTVKPHYVLDVEKAKREFQILLGAAILKLNYGFAKVQQAV